MHLGLRLYGKKPITFLKYLRYIIYKQTEREGTYICGVYGYIGNPEAKHEKFLLRLIETLGIETEERGVHATGFYGVSGDRVYTDKAPLKASDFYKQNTLWNSLPSFPNILIGHNRWASHGDPARNVNNHPFTSKRFGFIHNGIVGNVDVANENLKVISECDSEIMFRYFLREFHNYGGEGHPVPKKGFHVIEKTAKRFDAGDFACAIVDAKMKYLYLFRNAGRPLYITALPFCNTIVFASTKEILTRSLLKHNIHVPEKACKFLARGVITKIDTACKISSFETNLREPKKVVDVYSQYMSSHAINDINVINKKPSGVYKKSSWTVPQIVKPVSQVNNQLTLSIPTVTRYDETNYKGEGDWKCTKCGKKFPTAYLCKQHILSHGVGQQAARGLIQNIKYPNLMISFDKKEFGEAVINGVTMPASEVV